MTPVLIGSVRRRWLFLFSKRKVSKMDKFEAKTSEGDFHSSHARLKDAIDQADMIRGSVDFKCVKIEAGEGEDYDTGHVASINGTTATVRWDSGVVTAYDTDDVTAAQS